MRTTTSVDHETVAIVQGLIQINIDSRNGFQDAAKQVTDATLAASFREIAAERDQQASELSALVTASGSVPTESGSFAAAAHRGWMDLRSALGGGTHAVLAEAERGEDHIKAKYGDALRAVMAPEVKDLLVQHHGNVTRSHDRIRNLRDSGI